MVALSLHFHNQAYGNTLLHGERELLRIDTKDILSIFSHINRTIDCSSYLPFL